MTGRGHSGARPTHAQLVGALPVSLVSAGVDDAGRRPRLIAGQSWSPDLERSFSGSTYYLALAGMDEGLLDGAFGFVRPGRLRNLPVDAVGAAWKLRLAAARRRTNGFKFSPTYVSLAWSRVVPALREVDVVSNFQLVSRELLRTRVDQGTGLYFYIDGTLAQYFGTYGKFEAGNVDGGVVAAAIELEREGYRAADHVVAMTADAASSVVEEYGVSPDRVSVVLPGANLRDADVAEVGGPVEGQPFTICFVGLYPERKGIRRLLRIVDLVQASGREVRVRIVGNAPPDVVAHPSVEFLGLVDKRTQTQDFVEAISTAHLGCLLSEAELTGISLMESLRVGVPVVGSGAGGMAEILDDFGCPAIPTDMSDADSAAVIGRLIDDPRTYAALRREVADRRPLASWTRAARHLDRVIGAAGES